MAASGARVRICVITTTPYVVNVFLKRHLAALAEHYEVTLALNTEDAYRLEPGLDPRIKVEQVGIERKIAPLRDAYALLRLIGLLRKGRFNAVHTIAPKAGLLGIVAAWLAGIRVRIHTFQGEVWASQKGLARVALKAADRLVGRLLTHALVVGRGEQAFLEQHRVLKPGQSRVLLHGSIAGVDSARFHPDDLVRAQVRAELSIGPADFAVMYLGRIARDKGVLDLARAFTRLAPNSRLIFVGADEEGLRPRIEEICPPRLHFVPFNSSPERYLAAADVVCLPSYREGFSVTLIEAGACGVPVVASRLYGTQDALVDGITGIFHEPGNVEEIEQSLRALAGDAALRERFGRAGRERVLRNFRPEELIRAFLEYYTAILKCA